MSGWSRRWFGGGPGNAGRERREREMAERTAAEAATQDPYGPNAPQWDEAGFPVGPMPKGKFSLDYQYEANRRAELKRQVLWGDAQGSMRQGLDLFQSYRAGGSAAAASGMFQGKAGLYATQALNTTAPDLLIDWREQMRMRAEEKADELNRNSQLITGLSAFNFLTGGTPTTLVDQPTPPQAPSGPQGGTYNVGTAGQPPAAPGGGPQGGQTTPTPAAPGQPAAAGLAPEGSPEARAGGLRQAQPGSADIFSDYGGAAGGGQVAPGGGPRGDPGGGGRGGVTDESGAGMGGSQLAGGGGGLGDYSGLAAANWGVSSSPMSIDIATETWAEDPQREQSTALMVQSARETLISAMTIG